MELFAQTVLDEIKGINQQLRQLIDAVSPEGLDWRPAGEDTNSLYVLGTHMIGVQRALVALAADRNIERDRDAEFRARAADVEKLLAGLTQAETEIEEWLGSMNSASFEEPRQRNGRQLSAASCLTSALRHLGEHLGHASLTRQLWQRALTAKA